MSDTSIKKPLIYRFYYRFLEDCNAAEFVHRVATAYSLSTLHRLAAHPDRQTRRASVLALSMLGRGESTAVVGQCLSDLDRGVRLIAEDGLPAMWQRAGTFNQRQLLPLVMRYGAAGRYERALNVTDRIIGWNEEFGEAWFQRATIFARMGAHAKAAADCQRVLDYESSHYLSSMLMANSHFELGDLPEAIECLHTTLRIHPSWEHARHHLRRLQRALREQTDC